MPNYERHAESLEEFIQAVKNWQTAEAQGRATDEAEEEVFRTLAGAEAAVAAANVAFRLYATPTTRQADSLRDAVYVLRDTSVPKFTELLRQLDYALGRLHELAERTADDEKPIPVSVGPVQRVRNRWGLLSFGWKAFIALPGILASCGVVYKVVTYF